MSYGLAMEGTRRWSFFVCSYGFRVFGRICVHRTGDIDPQRRYVQLLERRPFISIQRGEVTKGMGMLLDMFWETVYNELWSAGQ